MPTPFCVDRARQLTHHGAPPAAVVGGVGGTEPEDPLRARDGAALVGIEGGKYFIVTSVGLEKKVEGGGEGG